MFDTHAHLNLPEYLNRIEEVVSNCRQAGLTGVVVASADLEESRIAVDLAKQYPNYLYAMVGIHPHQVNSKHEIRNSKLLKMLENLIKENKEFIVAVGETGLDDSEAPPRHNSPDGEKVGGQAGEANRLLDEQKELFNGQLNLAAKYDLPVVIHARGLVDEVIQIISSRVSELRVPSVELKTKHSERVTRNPQRNNPLDGVFHCYAGGKKRIQKVLGLPGRWYFGIDGNVTYDQGLQNVVAEIPHDRLVLETDSPWLTPQPHRGEVNTPAYLPLIVDQVAEIWQTTTVKVAEITVGNTQSLFNI
jgi:TatD DNase family protein